MLINIFIFSKKVIFSIICFVLLVFVSLQPVIAYKSPGPIINYVTDYANVLTESEEINLNQKLKAYDDESTNEIGIVTINSLDGDTIENFAVKLFEEYKYGKSDRDNGVLLLISIQDKKFRIEVGYGLEGALTDLESKDILDDVITPEFKKSNYYAGIDKGADAIIEATKGEYTSNSSASSNSLGGIFESIFPIVFFFFIVLIGPLSYAMARSRNSYILGMIIGLVFGITLAIILAYNGLWWLGLILLIPSVIVGFIIDFILSMMGVTGLMALNSAMPRSGGFGGGGGGFSGGGGRSGGGGASGGW